MTIVKRKKPILNISFLDNDVKRNWNNLSWLIFFTPFFIYAIRSLDKINPNLDIQYSRFIPIFLRSFDINFINNFFISTVLGSFLPIIGISIFEFINCLNNQKLDFRLFSIGKIKMSEGFKYADIWYYAISMLQRFPKILFFLTLGTSFFHDGLTNWFHNLYLGIFPKEYSSIFSILIFIFLSLLADFLVYINHRILHDIPLLWDLHEFHHSATEMTIISSARDLTLADFIVAPILIPFEVLSALFIKEFISQGLILPIMFYLIDYMFYAAFLYLGHSSLKVIYPKPLSLIYMSPACHLIHHSNNPDHFNKNFGNKYPFWDKLFNTFLDESHLDNIYGYGVENTQYNKFHPIYSYCILPINKMIKRFKSGTILRDKISYKI